MTKYFGTDGIRGVAYKDVTEDMAFKCGYALSQLSPYAKVVIGRDTRVSGEVLSKAFSSGLVMGGGELIDLGVVTTPTISWAVNELKCSYGVVISASHNPPNHNGIKIFDSQGVKINETLENRIETFIDDKTDTCDIIMGSYCQKPLFWRKYCKYLLNSVRGDLSNLKVVIDCSNGAGCKSAPYMFKKLGCKIKVINNSCDGNLINVNCGSQFVQGLQQAVTEWQADFGFALDGDGDRIIAVDNNGEIVDGDMILFALAKYYKSKGVLSHNLVVGTVNTNIAIVNELDAMGVKLMRSKVGDKHVKQMMDTHGALLGAEQSGHVIVGNVVNTGDGTATALQIANMLVDFKVPLSELTSIKLCPQQNINVNVVDKDFVVASPQVKSVVDKYSKVLSATGRIVLRASGTESKVRVMVECPDEKLCQHIAGQIVEEIVKVNQISKS